MYKTNPLLIEKCRSLRAKGFTLNEIIEVARLPKTTVYDHVRDIQFPIEAQKRIIRENIQRLRELSKKKKGKCLFGRIVPKPKEWTRALIFLAAHFMFDGEIKKGCIYQNRNLSLICRVQSLMKKIFNLKPRYRFYKESGVHRISYHYIELADYVRERAKELNEYIKTVSLQEKRIFLRVFFDDEGSVYKWRNARKVRGFQHNLEILKLVQKLLKDFDIESRIDEKYQEIVISRKPNLIKFRDKINFSKGVYINPDRKNSIWKKKLEKREILNRAIDSYILI